MDNGTQYQWLEGGKRLHLQHGPIDLIVEACGERESVALAYRQAHEAFQSVLSELVGELEYLRQPLATGACKTFKPKGRVARRMIAAALPCTGMEKLTPMIAVAGSVADHVLDAMSAGVQLTRAYVNNGGDIALWLSPDAAFDVGICENTETGKVGSHVKIQGWQTVRGIATSGWRGRSHSLGIADAVTVLAASAAEADVAATIIANAVDVPNCAGIQRVPANQLSPDSDLGDRPVTVSVDALDGKQLGFALERGRLRAELLVEKGLAEAVYISLQGCRIVCSHPSKTYRAGVMHA